MSKKIHSLFLALLLLLSLTACGGPKKNRYEGQFLQLFDTVTHIVGYANSKEEFGDYVQKIYDELEIYHQLYDIYNEYEGINNLKTINDQAGIAPVKVDQRIIDLLVLAREAYQISHGRMNVALGAVLRIWHDYREAGIDDPENAEVPPMALLQEAARHTDLGAMIIDEEAGTVYLTDPEMRLDVGSIGKGYAVERVAQYIMAEGLTDGLLSVGGNVRSFGYKGEDGQLWSIGITNPTSGGEDLFTVQLTDRSLVTSGDYIRYYTVDGVRYHHIIDPQTLMPAQYFTAVTIICQDSGLADVLSTTVFNMPYEQGLELIETLSDTEALWVFTDGSQKYSSGFEALLKK